MKLLRIINKQGYFLRDDFTFDETTEIGLDVSPAQGFYHPKWNGTEWVEGGQAPEPQPSEPTLEERAAQVETDTDEMGTTVDGIIEVLAELEGVTV